MERFLVSKFRRFAKSVSRALATGRDWHVSAVRDRDQSVDNRVRSSRCLSSNDGRVHCARH